jgi:hypothetical protein
MSGKDVAAMIFCGTIDRLAETLSRPKAVAQGSRTARSRSRTVDARRAGRGHERLRRAKTAELLKQIIKNRSVIVIERPHSSRPSSHGSVLLREGAGKKAVCQWVQSIRKWKSLPRP